MNLTQVIADAAMVPVVFHPLSRPVTGPAEAQETQQWDMPEQVKKDIDCAVLALVDEQLMAGRHAAHVARLADAVIHAVQPNEAVRVIADAYGDALKAAGHKAYAVRKSELRKILEACCVDAAFFEEVIAGDLPAQKLAAKARKVLKPTGKEAASDQQKEVLKRVQQLIMKAHKLAVDNGLNDGIIHDLAHADYLCKIDLEG